MNKPRPILDWLRERLKPPDVVPMKRTWGEYVRDGIVWAIKLFLIFIIRGC